MYGQAFKKELCYENLKITKNAWDSNIIQTNGKYISANWDASGGGAFAIIPVEEVGKAPDSVSLFRGHKGPVLDTSFNPFKDDEIVSCSDDGVILLWKIPEDYSFHSYLDENDNIRDITEPVKALKGHTRKVGHVEFHPCAENVLASSSLDYTVKIWNVETGEDIITLKHKDMVTSFAFNYNGTLLATTSRDKKLRVWDVRAGKVLSEGNGHTGAKPSRVAWLGNTDRIVTTGFSKLSDRQVGIWDVTNITDGPIGGFVFIDSSAGVLIPVFDESNSILYLAGKGDGNIRYYEYDKDELFELSQFTSTDPQRGFATAPKRYVNVKENEILKAFKTVNDNSIEPISFIVPRRSELFQEDIYPDCPSQEPSLTAEEFFEGKECNGPKLMSMSSLYEGSKPSIRDADPVTVISDLKEKVAQGNEKAALKKVEEGQATPKEKIRSEPKEIISVSDLSEEKKNVDDILKSSKEVDKMINKVSDDSDEEVNDAKDEEWEEVKRPTSFNENESVTQRKHDITEEQLDEKAVGKQGPDSYNKDLVPNVSDNTSDTNGSGVLEKNVAESSHESSDNKDLGNQEKNSNVDTAAIDTQKKDDVQDNAPSAVVPAAHKTKSNTSETKPSTPTLKGTIDRLALLVDKLETQVKELTSAGIKKDEKLLQLEQKINSLLEK